jgi:hypothetical protein
MLFLNQLMNNLINKIEFILSKMSPGGFVEKIRKKIKKKSFFLCDSRV